MYTGTWAINYYYKKGDIVSAYMASPFEAPSLYICCSDHCSSNCMFPSKEDIYWVYVDIDQLPIFQMPVLQPTPPPRPSSASPKRENTLKRKLVNAEKNLSSYKKQKLEHGRDLDVREQILLLDVNVKTKSFLMDKYMSISTSTSTDYAKGMAWLKTVLKLPFGKNKPFKVSNKSEIKDYIQKVKERLDQDVFGLEEVKQDILEFVARKISNPSCKGHVLALCGVQGTGKTKLIKSLAFALGLPMYQINCGGLNDVSSITGHSETYVGSKPGKIVEILQMSNCMNPIVYLDEIDKISEQKSVEINGVLTHLLDEEQNNKFQDNYLSNIDIDLSKVFFIVAFNDENKVDRIVLDRMHVIYIDSPALEQKVTLCQDKMIPEIVESIKFDLNVEMDKEVIEYIILNKCLKETGVRQLKKVLEKILNRLNYDILIDNVDGLLKNKKIVITRAYIDTILKTNVEDASYLSMYG